jgi:hypothetical protein
MITHFSDNIGTDQLPEFVWPVPEDEPQAGRIEVLEAWPRPLAGVHIDGKFLYCEYAKRSGADRSHGPLELAVADFKLLAEFVELAREGNLLAFASRYGALGLCKKHGWPFAHLRPHCSTERDKNESRIREPIARWRDYSEWARAILKLLVEKPPSQSDLELVQKNGDKDPYRAIIRWLSGTELKLWFRNRPSRLTLYGVPPLFTAIGLELGLVATGSKGIILCSACGRFDPAKRAGNPNQRQYCRKCRKRGRIKDAASDLRRRERRTLEMRRQGKSIADIAAALSISPEQVKRYLAKAKAGK